MADKFKYFVKNFKFSNFFLTVLLVDKYLGIDGSDFPRKKKHPDVAYRSHDIFDSAPAPQHPGDRLSRVRQGVSRGLKGISEGFKGISGRCKGI